MPSWWRMTRSARCTAREILAGWAAVALLDGMIGSALDVKLVGGTGRDGSGQSGGAVPACKRLTLCGSEADGTVPEAWRLGRRRVGDGEVAASSRPTASAVCREQ